MNRFVKTWLLWMLMLALPVQAQISVVQVSCEVGHQRQSGGHTLKLGHSGVAKASPRAKRLKTVMGQHGSKQLKKAVKTADQQTDHSVCGPCATCCGASASLPNINHLAAAWEISQHHFTLLPSSHVGHIPEGLERPPRLYLS